MPGVQIQPMARLSQDTVLPDAQGSPATAADGAALLVEQTRKLAKLNQWFELALNNMARGLSMFDAENKLVVCNALYRQIYELPDYLAAPGTALSDIIAYHTGREGHASTADRLLLAQHWIDQHRAELRHGKSFTYTQHLSNGRIILVTNQPLADGGWVDIQEDITERTHAEERIAWLARHCPLTEIPNRFHVRERLEADIARLRPGERLAVHLIDLDYFKQVNDSLGHATGDAVLKAVAKRMSSTIRDTDFVGRLGGDEFAVVQKEVTDIEQAASLAGRLVKILNAPYRVLGSSAGIGASIGISICPDHGMDADTLLQRADTALYRVKSCGRGSSAIYQPLDEEVARERIALQADLAEALKRRELALYYQPIVDVRNGLVTGCEALMRWKHPKLGLLLPSVFLPVAEKCGLVNSIGEWAIHRACRDAAAWPSDLKVAVNVSTAQLDHGNLAGAVARALEYSGLEPRRLEIEIPEKSLLKRSAHTPETLQKLKARGVRLVLDDFGTNFASLSYLKDYAFDAIKIDRSFIADLAGQRDKIAIVGAVTGLAHALGIVPIAKGVEEAEHLSAVSSVGCQLMQGFHFSQPVPSDEIDAALTACLAKMAPETAG